MPGLRFKAVCADTTKPVEKPVLIGRKLHQVIIKRNYGGPGVSKMAVAIACHKAAPGGDMIFNHD